MVPCSDIAANPPLCANRPKLIEGRATHNRWLIDPLSLIDIISSAVTLDSSTPLGPAAGVIRPIGLNDIVLDQRVLSPPIERQIRVLVGGVPGSVVGDGLRASRVPPLTADPVADVAPLASVGAVLQVRVRHAATAVVRPERVKVVAVEPVALRRAPLLARLELAAEVNGSPEELFAQRDGGCDGRHGGREEEWLKQHNLNSEYVCMFNKLKKKVFLFAPWGFAHNRKRGVLLVFLSAF